MSTTPNLGLAQMPQNLTQPSVPYNDAMQVLDALAQLTPLDKDLNVPPVTVATDVGKTWLVASAPTGAWAGQSGRIALCVGAGLWRFIAPKRGWRAFVLDENAGYWYNGTVWVLG
ncbi:MAG: hypothetical protein DDT26_00043 [Dehalococcoidia bacterium]|nr:hypothetical protein [Chloroflexota bacterium]